MDGVENINEDALSLFTILEPKMDILILGVGDHTPSAKAAKIILDFMQKSRINVELLRTQQVTFYNFQYLL